MQKGYARIAYSIGRGINQRQEIVGDDPLPDRLLDLLRTLPEKHDRNSEGAAREEEPVSAGFDVRSWHKQT
jgi:hypothetical protein